MCELTEFDESKNGSELTHVRTERAVTWAAAGGPGSGAAGNYGRALDGREMKC